MPEENKTKKYKSKTVTITKEDGTKKELAFTIQRAHQYWAERARTDLALYGEFVFGHINGAHHTEWLTAITDPMGRRILIVSPREYGKTMKIVELVTHHMGNNPIDTNIITSVSMDQAEKRLMTVRDIIETNPRYGLVFPHIKPDPKKPWTNTSFNILDTRISYHEFMRRRNAMGTAITMSCFASGMGGKGVVGNRISGWGIVDDPHDEEASYSPTTRKRAVDWYFRTFINCLLPGAKAVIITTRWNESDLAGVIKEEYAGQYKIIDIPAELTDDKGNRTSTWPAVWPIERLDEKRAEIGPRMYEALYKNNVHALSGGMFKNEWMYQYIKGNEPDELNYVIISVDPAITKKRKSDYTAIALCGWDKKYNFYLYNLWNLKLHPRDLGKRLFAIYSMALTDLGQCNKIAIEKTGAQVLIADELINETSLPIYKADYKGDKEAKATNLETLMSNGKFFANWKDAWGNSLRSQMLSFPNNSQNDDMVDAIAQAVNLMMSRSAGQQAKLKRIVVPYAI